MNNLLVSNSVILTDVDDLFFTLQLFNNIRQFDVVYVSINESTAHVLNNENLILLRRLTMDTDWTVMFYFQGVVDAKIKKSIDIIFAQENATIVPLRYGFLLVYSSMLNQYDSVFLMIDNIYRLDSLISMLYDKVIDMLIIDFNDGTDFDKINYLQKKLVYITKDVNIFDRNFKYKNIKKLSMKGEHNIESTKNKE